MTALPPPLPVAAARRMLRSVKWLLIVGVPLALLLFIGFIASVMLFVMHLLKDSEPYRHALAAARADTRVQAALGMPIDDGRFPTGSIETSNDSGHAQFSIPLHGPHGKATLQVDATRATGVWHYGTLRADLATGPVDLADAP